jgi:catechol 2,3-dioxygenase-like lactoylglutathione lyase family enzyme
MGAMTELRLPPGERGALHHVELWVPDIDRAVDSLGWLLETLGYVAFQRWDVGRSWCRGSTYIVAEQSPALSASSHDRTAPGLNHLAFHGGSCAEVEDLVEGARHHGWRLLFAERHPHAGGPEHYAAYLENADGFEVELVAEGPTG